MKKLKPGQLFTMYNVVWRVQKHIWGFPCATCELPEYWQNIIMTMTDKEIEKHRFYYPCTTMCRSKLILPNNCSAKMIKK